MRRHLLVVTEKKIKMLKTPFVIAQGEVLYIPYLFEYKSHFFIPENQSKNGGATYTRG